MPQTSITRTDSDVERGDAIQPQAATGILAVTFPFLPKLTDVKQVRVSPKKLRQHRVSYHRRISKENPILVTAQALKAALYHIFKTFRETRHRLGRPLAKGRRRNPHFRES